MFKSKTQKFDERVDFYKAMSDEERDAHIAAFLEEMVSQGKWAKVERQGIGVKVR